MPAELLPRGVSIVHRTRRGRDVRLYQVRVTWQGRRELLGRFDTLRDARAALVIAQADMLRGVFVPPAALRAQFREQQGLVREAAQASRYTVGELAEDYLEHVRRLGRKDSTIYDYRRRVETHIVPAFGSHPIDSVTADEVERWFDRLMSEHGNGAARGAYMQLSGMFNYATGQLKGLPSGFKPKIDRSPCQVVGGARHRPVKRAEASDQVVTRDQISAIAAEMPQGEVLAVLLSGWMALRIGEVLGLQRRDVRGEWLTVSRALQSRGNGLVLDTPKTKAGIRELPLAPDSELRAALQAQLAARVADAADAPLFPRASRGMQYLHPNVLRKHFAKAIEAANAKLTAAGRPLVPNGFVWHGLRHSSLTLIAGAGATTEELLTFGGHSDVQVAQRYQHATKTRLHSLVEKLSSERGRG